MLKKKLECFAWDYNDIPGLSKELVELKIPTYKSVKPVI